MFESSHPSSRITKYGDSWLISRVLLAVTFLGVWLVFCPGLISPDSNQTVYQALTRQYTSWWTPFGAWLLHWWLHVDLSLSLVFGVGIFLVVCGVYLCARFCLRRVPAALVTTFICLLPPVYADLSGLSRDLFFLGFTFCGFGLFGRFIQRPSRSRMVRVWLITGAIASVCAAYLCRQNALACVFALLLGLALWWRRRSGEGLGLRQSLIALVTAIVATAVVAIGVVGGYGVTGVRAVEPQRFTYVYDLASISVLGHHDRFPTAIVDRPHPGGVSPPDTHETALRQLFDPANVITLYPNNAAGKINFESASIASRENAILRLAWINAIEAEPLDYLWGRIRVIAIQLGFWRHPTDAFLPLLSPTNFGNPLVFPRNYQAASSVLSHFVGPTPWIPLDIPWTWLLVIIGCVAVLLRRIRSLAWHFLVMPVAVVVNYLLLLAATMAAGFRYVVLEVPVALLLVAYVIAVFAVESERWRELVEPAFRTLVDQAATPGPSPTAIVPEIDRVGSPAGA